ncbi:MAG: hypothetical protein ACR2J3_03000 [Aridibacter sp.]
MSNSKLFRSMVFCLSLILLGNIIFAQENDERRMQKGQQDVRIMTIPITIFTKKELKEKQAGEFVEAGDITLKENEEEQTILSIRSVSNTPLSLAVLIQDDLSSNVNLQLKDLANFIRSLPKDSRVMVAYIRGGSLQVRQNFTQDLDEAAKSLRIVISNSAVAPRSPYDGVQDALKRFKGLPNGRRAILLLSDGLDVSQGVNGSTPGQSLELDRAILKAQRSSVAVYSFYSAATFTESGNSILVSNGQGSLNKLSEETGGKAFFQGTFTPISYQPFFRDLNLALSRQFALTYISTHMKKGYYKIDVISTNPEVKIEHPRGYYYRK